jgi:hypothetical protein
MLIFDFFSGTGSSTQAFVDAGHTVVSFELDDFFDATETVDVMSLSVEYLLERYGRPDFVWASPPCTAFSVSSMGHHWISGGVEPVPRTQAAVDAQAVVARTLELIDGLNPLLGWLVENPRGMLRKLPVMSGRERRTVTYCQYGDERMKPTDLWGFVPGWAARAMCKNGDPCHVSAPRGSQTGTQASQNPKTKSMVPYGIGLEILEAIS